MRRTRVRRLTSRRALLLCLVLALTAAVVATTRRYCEEAYVNDCLNSVHCDYYNDAGYAGGITINYSCPV